MHLAGLTYWVDQRKGQPQYFERLLDRVAADETAPANNGYFDVATLHLYTDPRALYHVPRLYRELMRARGLDKPIWIDETNVIPWDDATNRGTGDDVATEMRCTLADQASYLLQAFGLGLAGGAERLAVYKAQDGAGAAFNGDVDAVERAALVREDGSLRPAYVAYQTAARYLAEAQAAEYFPSPTAETVVVDRAAAGRTTVLWNASGKPVVARLARSGRPCRASRRGRPPPQTGRGPGRRLPHCPARRGSATPIPTTQPLRDGRRDVPAGRVRRTRRRPAPPRRNHFVTARRSGLGCAGRLELHQGPFRGHVVEDRFQRHVHAQIIGYAAAHDVRHHRDAFVEAYDAVRVRHVGLERPILRLGGSRCTCTAAPAR